MIFENWKNKNKFAFIFSTIFLLISFLNIFTGLKPDAMGTPSLSSLFNSIYLGYGWIALIIIGIIKILTENGPLLAGSVSLSDKYLTLISIVSSIIYTPVSFFIGRVLYWIYKKINK